MERKSHHKIRSLENIYIFLIDIYGEFGYQPDLNCLNKTKKIKKLALEILNVD